jgi:hypothetical protein
VVDFEYRPVLPLSIHAHPVPDLLVELFPEVATGGCRHNVHQFLEDVAVCPSRT